MTKLTIILNIFRFLISREALYQFIKKSIFSLTIIGITSQMYIAKFGNYCIDLDKFDDLLKEDLNKTIYTVTCFGTIFLVSYLFEKKLLPFILIFSGQYDSALIKDIKKHSNKYIFRIAPRAEMKEAMIVADENRFDLYGYLSYLPTLLTLFIIYLSLKISLFLLILIIPIFIAFHWFIRLTNTAIKEYKK